MAYFGLNSSVVDESSAEGIRQVLDRIRGNSSTMVRLEGFASSDGPATYNQMLSEQRAASVKALLMAKGAPADRITTTGLGSTDPLASNDTPAGRARNRRVEVRF